MLAIDTILTPIDFSEKSKAAAEQAVALAMHFDAAVLLLHVLPATPHDPMLLTGGGGAGEAGEIAAATAKLNELAAEVAMGCDCQPLVAKGEPAHRIEVAVREHNVDLVVLPTHGHGLFRRLLLGSVTAKVLHDVAVPVLTGVHMEDRRPFEAGAYKKIACAVGMREREHSEKALRWAWSLAQSWGAELHVIHVPPAIDWGAGEWFPDETQALVREAARERLAALVADVGCKAVLHTAGLEAARYVVDVVKENQIDALVVGRSVSHGLLPGFGANAFSLIRESPCPVFSV
jgi:nucleotide-binding universal stress UspA family protein